MNIPLCLLLLVSSVFASSKYFIFISDIHQDPFYLTHSMPGKEGDWCRKRLPLPEHVAATFGRPGCDIPYPLAKSCFDAAKRFAPDPEFILVGGDLPSHDLPSADVSMNLVRNVTKEITTRFPHVPIISTIGNNDVYPGYTAPDLFELSKVWGPAMKNEKAAEEFSRQGFYRFDLNNSKLTFLVLSTNMYSPSYKDSFSFFSSANYKSNVDPFGQFQWLEKQLKRTYSEGRSVLIAGHIAPGPNAYDDGLQWQDFFSERYLQLVQTFGSHIAAQFFGHIHATDYRLISPNTGPIFIGGAVSSVYMNNPNFKVVFYNEEEIVDIDTYYLDLFLANKEKKTVWKKESSLKSLYNLDNLSSKSLDSLTKLVIKDRSAWNRYIDHRSSLIFPRRFAYGCAMRFLIDQDYRQCLIDNSNEYYKSFF
ncbi:hypothetical protein P9112_002435 [Eukaryota sp. TZLM1-RC]